LGLDPLAQRVLDSLPQRRPLGAGETSGWTERVDPRPEQRLVGVDVPDAGDPRLIEHERLDRGTPPPRARAQVLGGEPWGERLDPEPRGQVLLARLISVHEMAG